MMRLLIIIVALFASSAFAVEPDEVLDDPALEQRALDISRNLRCVVCQSQSIDDSDAPLARDMRLIVRERLVAGDTDTEVYAYLVARYGDYVLLKPPVQPNTYFLWAAPALILLAAGGGAWVFLKQVRKSASGDDDGEEVEPSS